MIRAWRTLRDLDRLYFGRRAGRGSALSALGALLTGVMPGVFLDYYLRGDFDEELAAIGLRG